MEYTFWLGFIIASPGPTNNREHKPNPSKGIYGNSHYIYKQQRTIPPISQIHFSSETTNEAAERRDFFEGGCPSPPADDSSVPQQTALPRKYKQTNNNNNNVCVYVCLHREKERKRERSCLLLESWDHFPVSNPGMGTRVLRYYEEAVMIIPSFIFVSELMDRALRIRPVSWLGGSGWRCDATGDFAAMAWRLSICLLPTNRSEPQFFFLLTFVYLCLHLFIWFFSQDTNSHLNCPTILAINLGLFINVRIYSIKSLHIKLNTAVKTGKRWIKTIVSEVICK